MAEQRLFHTKGTDAAGKQVHEGFYKAHTVSKVREDVKQRSGAVEVTHENLTSKPTEFYDRLKDVESKKVVKHDKVPGLGHRWEVQGDDSPFGTAPVDGGGVPPSLHNFPDDEFGWSAEDERHFRENYDPNNANLATPDDDDRVGLPDDPDEYEKDIIVHEPSRPANFPRGQNYGNDLRAKPEFYDTGKIILAEDPIAELTRQDKMFAIGGFEVPKGSEKADDTKYDTGKLKTPTPTIEELDRELDRLKQDPSTYPYPRQEEEDEVRAASSRSQAVAYFI